MYRLRLLILCFVLATTSCGCGRSLNIAPSESQERCRDYVDGDFADYLILGEEVAFDIFDTTDTGERVVVPIRSVESSDPSVVEVTMLEDALEDDFARVTVKANAPGTATLRIESRDDYTSDQVIEVVASEDELPTAATGASCPRQAD